MKAKDLISAMANMLGLDARDLELGFNAFVSDFKMEGAK